MQPEETILYDRIDEYITHFYQKYESERRGLGFVMTVYRRRLTSSFYAVRRSLERRLDYLRGEIAWEDAYSDDDTEQDELEFDLGLDSEEGKLSEAERQRFDEELHYVEDFIGDLRSLSINDSKLERLKDDLQKAFRKRNTVLIFTQYTDTMDYIRNQLVEVYGSQVACYSGRGGETWNGIAWALDSKENVKNQFRDGEIRILVCTESASEGLNLQTCGVLINYDMPWNPMKVEQRIGRIDRIGQKYDEVWIWNYFYRDTIEDQIYERLASRINWFEAVVGKLQPILARVGQITRDLAMLSANEREIELEKRITELQEQLQKVEVEALNLDDYQESADYIPSPESPVSLKDLENLFTESDATGHLFTPHPTIEKSYNLRWKKTTLPVTFSKSCFDEHPSSVRFMTFGNSIFEEILSDIAEPEINHEEFGLVRAIASGEFDMRGWYITKNGDSQLIESLLTLKQWIKGGGDGDPQPPNIQNVKVLFNVALQKLVNEQNTVIVHRRKAANLALKAKAHRLLLKAAMAEIALGQRPELFDKETYPNSFTEEAVKGLTRRHYPWAPLIKLVYTPGLKPEEDDRYYLKISNNSKESLRAIFVALQDDADKLVRQLSNIRTQSVDQDQVKVVDNNFSFLKNPN